MLLFPTAVVFSLPPSGFPRPPFTGLFVSGGWWLRTWTSGLWLEMGDAVRRSEGRKREKSGGLSLLFHGRDHLWRQLLFGTSFSRTPFSLNVGNCYILLIQARSGNRSLLLLILRCFPFLLVPLPNHTFINSQLLKQTLWVHDLFTAGTLVAVSQAYVVLRSLLKTN